jgi:WD40 repeat protein/uncharacterized protein YjbI with pentapeptide repeats/predicted MPP superfamily phosphohydrolase
LEGNHLSLLLRWLHLTDFHFEANAALDSDEVFQALKRKLRDLKDKGLVPNVVFVTGDIAASGHEKEFLRAETSLAELAECIGVDVGERWFVIPGNHDVNWSGITSENQRLLDALHTEEDIEELFANELKMHMIHLRLNEYYKFTSRFLGASRSWDFLRPWRTDQVQLQGLRIGILQLNSSWASGKNEDRGRLLLGSIQVSQALAEVAGSDLCIALVHHPLDYLREWDLQGVEGLLVSSRGAQLQLRGHRHQNSIHNLHPAFDAFCEVATGACYVREKYFTGFNLGEIAVDGRLLRLRMFRYSPEQGGFWTPDNLIDQSFPDGIASIPFRKSIIGIRRKPERRRTVEEELEAERVLDPADRGDAVQTMIRLGRARAWTLKGLYRVQEGYDLLRWTTEPGMLEHTEIVLDTASVPNSQDDMFALRRRLDLPAGSSWEEHFCLTHVRTVISSELRLRAHAQTLVKDFDLAPLAGHYVELWAIESTKGEQPVHTLLQEWLSGPNQVHLTMLGEYGAGKTSITRKLARDLASEYLASTPDRRAPVWIDLSLGKGGQSGEDLIRAALGLNPDRVSDELIHLAIEQGLLVILLDSFDELTARGTESQVLDSYTQLSQLARGPRSKVMLTCRTSSFNSSASLEGGIAALEVRASTLGVKQGGFRVVELKELRPDQVREYIKRRVPDNLKRKELEDCIQQVYDLQDLSSRPLLLEMIVSVRDELLRIKPSAGLQFTRASLYRMFTDQWIHHAPKRVLTPEQKEAIAHHLARSLYDLGVESLPSQSTLEAAVKLLGNTPQAPDFLPQAAIETRTAHFLVRTGRDRLRFAHNSFLEYFVARDIFLKLNSKKPNVLPERYVSETVASFLHQMMREAKAGDLLADIDTIVRSTKSDQKRAPALIASYRLHRIALATDDPKGGDVLTKELEHAWGRKLSLQGIDFGGIDLSYAFLAEADLRGSSLDGAVLNNVVLSGANLCDAHLNRVVADKARFDNSSLSDAALDEASLVGADLTAAVLNRCKLRAARLDAALLRGACLDGSRLKGARLRATDLTGASAASAEFDFALISEAQVCGLDLTGASLLHTAFHATDLVATRGIPRVTRGMALGPRGPDRIELPQPPWQGGGATPSSVCWFPDGSQYAVSSWDGAVRLFDTRLSRLLRVFAHPQAVRKMSFSIDGRYLLTACHDGIVRLWNIEAEEVELKYMPLAGGHGRAMACAISADNQWIAGGWSNRVARVFSLHDSSPLAELWHEAQVRDCAFSPTQGHSLITVCADGYARLWDIKKKEVVHKFWNSNHRLRACAVSPDGRLLATGSEDLCVRIFDLDSRSDQPRTVIEHDGPIWCCSYSRDGQFLATGAEDGKARVFRTDDSRAVAVFDHGGWVWSCAFSPDGSLLLTCCDDGTVRTFRLDSVRAERIIPHGRWVRSAVVSSDSGTILAACNDQAARLFQASTGLMLHEWPHGSWVRGCSVSDDARVGLTVGGDGYVRLFDLVEGRLLLSLDQGQRVRACAFQPGGQLFAFGRADGHVNVYSKDGSLISRSDLLSEVWSLAFTTNGCILAGCHDGKIYLIDFNSGSSTVLDQLEGSVRACACSQRVIAAGCAKEGLRLWDASSLKKLPTLPLTLECWSCSFSPDGSKILTSWADSVVRCHVLDSLKQIATIRHPGWAWTCSFFPDGERILTGCDDGRLRTYAISADASQDPILLLTIAAAFPLPHGQSPSGYFAVPQHRDPGCDVICQGASYPLALLSPTLNRPDLVQASYRGERVPGVDDALASAFPLVRVPTTWPA